MAPKFRSNTWDPVLIISQMVCMQCLFYVSTGVLLILSAICFLHTGPQLSWLFDDHELRLAVTSGKFIFAAYLISPLFCSLGLWRFVNRTKQCLDFSCTLYFWHMIFCILYTRRFPQSPLWWITNVVSIVVTTVMGEFLCMRSELKVIPLQSSGVASGSSC